MNVNCQPSTPFTASLAIPAPDINQDNTLLLSVVEGLDKSELRVEKLVISRHLLFLNLKPVRSLIISVSGDCPIDNATEDEIEQYIVDQFTKNKCEIDAHISRITVG